MADNFNVKNYLRENKLGAYRLLNEAFDGFGGVHDLNPISNESPVTGKKKVKEAFYSPGESEQDMIEKWLENSDEEYSDYDFDGDDTITLYDGTGRGFKQLSFDRDIMDTESSMEEALGKEGSFSLDDLVTLWDEMYGEDFKEEYSGFYDELNPDVSLTIRKVAELWDEMYGEDFKYEYPAVVKKLRNLSSMEEAYFDNPTGEAPHSSDIELDDDDHDRFWDLGGAEVHSGVKSLLDDGFELEDIIDFIKSHFSSGRPDDEQMPFESTINESEVIYVVRNGKCYRKDDEGNMDQVDYSKCR